MEAKSDSHSVFRREHTTTAQAVDYREPSKPQSPRVQLWRGCEGRLKRCIKLLWWKVLGVPSTTIFRRQQRSKCSRAGFSFSSPLCPRSQKSAQCLRVIAACVWCGVSFVIVETERIVCRTLFHPSRKQRPHKKEGAEMNYRKDKKAQINKKKQFSRYCVRFPPFHL